MNILDKNDKFVSLSLILLFFIPFYLMPPYADDIARFSSHYIGLYDQGRFLSELLILAINGFSGSFSLDVYPLLLTLSIAISYVLLKDISKHTGLKMYMLLPVVITPYMLENISYHVDIICMFLSFYLSVKSSIYCFYRKKITLSILLLSFASFFYQTSFSTFAAAVTLFSIIYCKANDMKTRDFALRIAPSIFVFIISFIIVILSTKIFAASGYYVDIHSSFIKINSGWLESFILNIKNINNIAFGTLPITQKILISLILLIYISSLLLTLTTTENKRKSIITLVLPVFSIILLYLPTSLFSNPVIMPRVMMSYGFILVCFLVAGFTYNKYSKLATSITSIAFMITVVICSSAYVSSTNYIYKKNISIAKEIQTAIMVDNQKDMPVLFYGELKPSASGINLISEKSFPIIKVMTRFPLNNSWLTPHIFNLYDIDLKYDEPKNKNNHNERVKVYESKHFTLYKTMTHYIAVFK